MVALYVRYMLPPPPRQFLVDTDSHRFRRHSGRTSCTPYLATTCSRSKPRAYTVQEQSRKRGGSGQGVQTSVSMQDVRFSIHHRVHRRTAFSTHCFSSSGVSIPRAVESGRVVYKSFDATTGGWGTISFSIFSFLRRDAVPVYPALPQFSTVSLACSITTERIVTWTANRIRHAGEGV